MTRSFLLAASLVLLAACAAPPASTPEPAAAPPAPTAPVAPASAAPTAAPVPPLPSRPTRPHAQVTSVAPGNESALDARVRITFHNPEARPCRVTEYQVAWPGGKKRIQLEDLVIPPAESRDRTLRVHPSDGDLKTLGRDATVVLRTDCDRP